MERRTFNASLLAGAAGAFVPQPADNRTVRINAARLNAHLAELAQFGRNAQGGISRVAYTEFDRQARDYAVKLMREARLEPTIDAAGNIVGRRAGRDSSLPPLTMGSHIDSVPEGGNYDGQVGSMGAIEVAQTLAEKGVALRHPLEVIIFENEEGGTYGSHAMAAPMTEKALNLVTQSGKTVREGIRFIGGDPDRLLLGPLRKRGEIAAYLELHIEQGGILDSEKLDIGVVEGIVGISQWEVTVEGFANHAGTTPMNQRRDAMLAAARFIDMVNRVVTGIPGRQVGTVGKLQAQPGAYNVIPGRVTLGLELRDLDAAKIDTMFSRIQSEAASIAAATGTTFSYKPYNKITPALCDSRIQKLIDGTAKELGLRTKYMPSGAGHDAQEMARIGPAAMIFIPSKDGISHSPREYSRPEDIANGANVLLQTLLKLDA